VVGLHWGTVVRCANPDDGDFPPLARVCDGMVTLRPNADEGGGDYQCPICERIVFPTAYRKHQFDTLTILLDPKGIEQYLISQCGDLVRGRQFQNGVLILPVAGLNAALCLVDFCSDAQWLGRNAAAARSCVYVTVGTDVAPRMMREDAIAHVELAEILLGSMDLRAALIDRVGHTLANLLNVDLPVYALGARPIAPTPEGSPSPRRFVVALTAEGFWVDGLLVVKAERVTAILILRALRERFVDGLTSGGVVAPMSADDLANAVQRGGAKTQDADTMRKTIDRIRADIASAIRKTGKPIGEDDVIENVSRTKTVTGAQGYCLNPQSVVLGVAPA
jgi:hypothetical protein